MGRALRLLLLAVLAGGLGACSSSSLPDLTQFKLPNPELLLPSNSSTYSAPPSARILRPVGPEDLVDANGYCAGMAAPVAPEAGSDQQAPAPAPVARGGPVGLEMAECEVVRNLGPPQSAQLSATPQGDRNVVLIYRGETSADYRFVNGRLVSLERGPEPPAPPKVAKKPPPKKPAKKQPAA
jgi:hypothetical protein